MKINVNGKLIELTDSCRFSVIDNKLFNINTKHFEAVEGDTVEFKHKNNLIKDTVVGYTTYQCVNTKNHGNFVLPVKNGCVDLKITHNTKVFEA